MKKLISIVVLCCISFSVFGQCMMVPLPFEGRVQHAHYIVKGRINSAHSYWDSRHQNIFTAYHIQVSAWLKGYRPSAEIVLISEGGVVEGDAQVTQPSVHPEANQEFVLMLSATEEHDQDLILQAQSPQLIQAKAYACNQGMLKKQKGLYYDILVERPKSESTLFSEIAAITGEAILKPDGSVYRSEDYHSSHRPPSSNARITAISTFSPTPTNAGTIVAGDFITITGSGFGAAAGTVFFSNADDGGATFTSSGVASDIVSWSDASITVKVASTAGTGPINVNGAMTSGSNLTVTYAHTCVNSNFSGFASATRQRYYHRNFNGAGGMYFLYNTTSGFSANTAAVAAFERALESWRCATFINWWSNGTTATGIANDGISVVMFDGTLPAGVLGRATSRFAGSATGGCNLANTVWCVNDIDVQFFPDPPSAGFTWNYGPAAPTFSQYDMESVAVHELGHAHGLGHRIAAGQVMNFAIANGSSARTPAAAEISGGTARMTYSTAATCFNPAAASCGNGPMTALSSGTCVLAFEDIHFSGNHEHGTGNVLIWQTDVDADTHLELQRSEDGNLYTSIYSNQEAQQQAAKLFNYIDSDIEDKGYYYKLTKSNSSEHFSQMIYVSENHTDQFHAYYNQETHSLRVEGPVNINAEVIAYDVTGKILSNKRFSEEIDIPLMLSSGIYYYTIYTSNSVESGKFVSNK